MAKITLAGNPNTITYPIREYDFSPSTLYPEYPWDKEYIAGEKNEVYDLVRECLHLSGSDKEHYGTKEWNPLGEAILPGQTVLIKPNWVENKNSNPDVHDDLACLETNPSVVRFENFDIKI